MHLVGHCTVLDTAVQQAGGLMDGAAGATLENGPAWARGVLASYGPMTPTQAERIAELEDELRAIKDAQPIDGNRMRWTNSAVYMIVSAFLAMMAFVVGFDQRARSDNADRKAEIAALMVKIEAREKVDAADQRYRDLKDATQAEALKRIEALSQLNDVQIRSLQKERR